MPDISGTVHDDIKVLEMRRVGMTPSQIAYQMGHGWTHQRVVRDIDRMSNAAVARRNTMVDEQHMLMLTRLEWLHHRNSAVLETMAEETKEGIVLKCKPGEFASLISSNVKILERISKMLGLDKVPGQTNWASKSEAELAETAAQLGIDISMVTNALPAAPDSEDED